VLKKDILVTDKGSGMRLDVYLASEMREQSRSRLSKMIDGGMIRVNGDEKKPGFKLKAGDRISVSEDFKEEKRAVLSPRLLPLEILFCDEDIIVVDKPSGMVVHPGAGTGEATLVHALLGRFPEIAGVGSEERPGIVHRLDKDTSGVMVVARTTQAHACLTKQFRDRDVRKTYLGLVLGKMPSGEGRLDWAIGRHPTQRQKISVKTRKPRPAVTQYKVLREGGGFSLLEIKPITGRTHQIRVHMAAAGHPVAGDSRYGGWRGNAAVPRLFLHAHKLSFLHPSTGERVEFVSELPRELAGVLGLSFFFT
jgi:23S rRNA pseudouridine1911/1915/1917 synthase